MKKVLFSLTALLVAAASSGAHAADRAPNVPPEGFHALFNGRDLTGWQGLIELPKREKMSPQEREAAQAKANELMAQHWSVENGVLVYDGKGQSLQSAADYRNFELYVDWKLEPKGDSGIYLRGTPQVQIWDRAAGSAIDAQGNFKGSGGLFNNQKNPSAPLKVADRATGEWNTFFIRMIGDRVWVWLNGEMVVDNTPLENYWDRERPLPASGPIELQHHGNRLEFRNIFVRKLPDTAGAPSREQLVTLNVSDAPLQQVIQLLSSTGHVSIVLTDPAGTLVERRVVFMNIKDLPVPSAVQQLCRAAGLQATRDGSGAYIISGR